MGRPKIALSAGSPTGDCGSASDGTAQERRLIHIPIIHTEADMGALRQPIREMTVARMGPAGWERNVGLIEAIWRRIEEAIEGWRLPYARVRLYQDGLPVCGRESEIVAELAEKGSRNHRLLLRLQARGARLMGTESGELLVQEYQLIKQALEPSHPGASDDWQDRQRALSKSLLTQRDHAIAERINATLRPGETGLLFLGMLHSLGPGLAKDIRVSQPLFPAQSG